MCFSEDLVKLIAPVLFLVNKFLLRKLVCRQHKLVSLPCTSEVFCSLYILFFSELKTLKWDTVVRDSYFSIAPAILIYVNLAVSEFCCFGSYKGSDLSPVCKGFTVLF